MLCPAELHLAAHPPYPSELVGIRCTRPFDHDGPHLGRWEHLALAWDSSAVFGSAARDGAHAARGAGELAPAGADDARASCWTYREGGGWVYRVAD